MILWVAFAVSCLGATYSVGPGQTYANINDVALESLVGGDVIEVHYRATPYREKFVLCATSGASANNPLILRGVPNANGQLPIISGDGATTRQALNYWNEPRGLVKVGGASVPSCPAASFVTIEKLHLRNAASTNSFTDDNGSQQTYADNAAAVYIEAGADIVIQDCEISGSGNGIFAGYSNGATQRLTVRRNRIYGNGVPSSIFEHNVYTEADGIVFEGNWMGALCPTCPGNNLKDRSAGTVVRYNWIEEGNRQLDLVDSGSATLRAKASYGETHVYGNVLFEKTNSGNRQLIHFGGDLGTEANYRGTLFAYYNTFMSNRTGRTSLVRLSSDGQTGEFYNNIVWRSDSAAADLELFTGAGTLNLRGTWVRPGWTETFSTKTGTTSVTNSVDGTLASPVNSSNAIPLALIPGTVALPAGLPAVTNSYPAIVRSSLTDIGAFEFGATPGTTNPGGGSGGGGSGGGSNAALVQPALFLMLCVAFLVML